MLASVTMSFSATSASQLQTGSLPGLGLLSLALLLLRPQAQ